MISLGSAEIKVTVEYKIEEGSKDKCFYRITEKLSSSSSKDDPLIIDTKEAVPEQFRLALDRAEIAAGNEAGQRFKTFL